MEQMRTVRPDDSVPSIDRQDSLRSAARANLEAGKDPYASVSIRTRGELIWILGERGWSGDVDGYKKVRPNLRGADLFGINLRNVVLAGADLEGAYCERSDLSGADLRLANLRNTNFVASALAGAVLLEADLTGSNLSLANLRGANLAGATLADAILNDSHLEDAYLFLSVLHRAVMNSATVTNANLMRASLAWCKLTGATLSGAIASDASFEGAMLDRANLSGATLDRANLSRANLLLSNLREASATEVDLAGANLTLCDLRGVDLRSCRMDATTVLDRTTVADRGHSSLLADVRWNGVNITVIDWSKVEALGDDRLIHEVRPEIAARLKDHGLDKTLRARIVAARKGGRLEALQSAIRANRQLATQLASQGLNEDSNRFAYRAQILRRRMQFHERKFAQYIFSLMLDGIAGYGYVPIRSLIAYLMLVMSYAMAYFIYGVYSGHQLQWFASIVVSLTAFHGRGFFPNEFSPADPQAVLAASEAVLGLIVEISFIATFTQRFLGK